MHSKNACLPAATAAPGAEGGMPAASPATPRRRAVDDPLVRVKAEVAAFRGHFHLVRHGLFDVRQPRFELVAEHVAHGGQLAVWVGPQRMDGGPRAASAASDQADFSRLSLASREATAGPEIGKPAPRRGRQAVDDCKNCLRDVEELPLGVMALFLDMYEISTTNCTVVNSAPLRERCPQALERPKVAIGAPIV